MIVLLRRNNIKCQTSPKRQTNEKTDTKDKKTNGHVRRVRFPLDGILHIYTD